MSVRYLVSRLIHSILVVLALLTLVFFATHVLGDPTFIALPPTATPEQIAALRERLRLDDPILVQFGDFVAGALTGDFGESFWQRRPAIDLVFGRIPATIYLAIAAFVLILPIGVGLGILAALKAGSVIDRAINVVSFIGVSIVDFWLALMLILIFAVQLRWLPTSGIGGIDHVLLPALTLTILGAGTLAQITRVSILEELGKSYVSAARARGVSEFDVTMRHALRNALIPIVTLGGGVLIGLLNGALVAEAVFGWPGVGRLIIQAIQERDLPLIEAAVFYTALLVVAMNFLVDVLYALVNPRVRFT